MNRFNRVNFKAFGKNGQASASLIKFNGRQNLIPSLSNSASSSIKSSNNYSTCFKKENYHTLNKVMKNLFAIKNYSTSTLLSESEQKTTQLDVTNYKNWTTEQVCSLLCLAESGGGAGLSETKVKPFYDAGFMVIQLVTLCKPLLQKRVM